VFIGRICSRLPEEWLGWCAGELVVGVVYSREKENEVIENVAVFERRLLLCLGLWRQKTFVY